MCNILILKNCSEAGRKPLGVTPRGKRWDSGLHMTEESSRMSLSASSLGIMDSAVSVGAPVYTKGRHQMVFSPGISVRGIQESTGDPGHSQHMNGEGLLSWNIWPGTHSYTKISPNSGVVAPGEQVGVSCWQTKHQYFDIDCGSRPRVGLALPSPTPTHAWF